MKGPRELTVYDPNDIMRTTIKETNIHDTRSGNLNGPKRVLSMIQMIMRTTIKETNIHDLGINIDKGPKKELFMIRMIYQNNY